MKLIPASKLRWLFFMAALIFIAAGFGCGQYGSDGSDSDDDDENDDDDDVDDDDDTVGSDDDDIPYTPPDGFEVVFYDVGQGESALLRFPQGSTMLVDAGWDESGDDVVLPHFDEIHLDYVDYMVMSHPHADHIGGMDEVIEEVEVGEFWTNGDTHDTVSWDRLNSAVYNSGAEIVTVERGYYTSIDGCDVDVLAPSKDWFDLNANSMVMTIECEGVIFMFTGDILKEQMSELITYYGDALASDILKVPHHGSPDVDHEFPDYVLPSMALFSCGWNNPYGHPDPEVVTDYESVGADIYRTDQDGTVVVLAKDGQYTISTD